MKVWKAEWCDRDSGHIVSWHPSKREATAALAAAKRDEDAQEPCAVRLEEIPCCKSGIIEWLNQNFNTENG